MRFVFLLLLLAAVRPAAGQPGEQRAGEIFGTLLAPTPAITLPPDATLTLRVLYKGGPETLAERTVPTAGQQLPLAFSVPYEASRVRSYSGYVLHADIHDAAGTLLWSNTISPPIPPGVMFLAGMASTWAMDVYGEAPPARPDPAEAPGPVGVVAIGPSAPRRRGAAPRPTPAPVSRDVVRLTMGRWRLVEGVPAEGPAVRGDDAAAYTLTFRSGHLLSGETACGSFHGTYTAADGGTLAVGPREASLTRCAATPADAAVDRLLGAAAGFSATRTTLELTGSEGVLRFAAIAAPGGLRRPPRGVVEYDCGAGTFRLKAERSTRDTQLWLSDALADRPAGTGRAGIYHVLAQVPAPRGVRYGGAPLSVSADGWNGARLTLGDETLACSVDPASGIGPSEVSFNVADDVANIEVYTTEHRAALIRVFDGGSSVGMIADVSTPAPGQTVYRGPYGFTLTTVEDGCAGHDSTRATVSQPERTYTVCIPAVP